MNIVYKLLGTGISAAAGFVASKAVNAAWKKSTGQEPPKDGTNLEYSLRSALVFALVSSAVGAVIQVLTGRGTQKALIHFNKTSDEI